jgi:hypothetical protein
MLKGIGLFLQAIVLVSLFTVLLGRCSSDATEKSSAVTGDAFEQNVHLGRGVNLGNALEAPKEGEWGVTLREEYFHLIAEAGFDSVRIPIRWSAHAALTEPPTASKIMTLAWIPTRTGATSTCWPHVSGSLTRMGQCPPRWPKQMVSTRWWRG